jgi:hypothetical protein
MTPGQRYITVPRLQTKEDQKKNKRKKKESPDLRS